MTLNKEAAVISSNGITIVQGARTITVPPDHPNYERIRNILESSDVPGSHIYDQAFELADIPEALNIFVQDGGAGNLTVDTDRKVVQYNGDDLPDMFAHKLLSLMRHEMSPVTILNFLEKLYANPLPSAIEDLLPFCAANDFMLWDDGDILGFKSVKQNWTDHHSGSFDNSPGQIVTMPRESVDADRNVTCSRGLHIAARAYAESFGQSGKLLVVKVNPIDVIAVPNDYDRQKMRCCRYQSICEIGRGQALPNSIGVYSPIDFELAQELVVT